MVRKRRKFAAEFKARVTVEALRERDSVQVIAARHGGEALGHSDGTGAFGCLALAA